MNPTAGQFAPETTMTRDIDWDTFDNALQCYPIGTYPFQMINDEWTKLQLSGFRKYINEMIYKYYAYHYIISSPIDTVDDVTYFLDRLDSAMHTLMAQHQVVITQFISMASKDFWQGGTEDETYTRDTGRTGTTSSTSDSQNRNALTPQSTFGSVNMDDLNLSSASRDNDTSSSENSSNEDRKDTRHLDKASPAQMLAAFRQFLQTNDIYQSIIDGVGHCFIRIEESPWIGDPDDFERIIGF